MYQGQPLYDSYRYEQTDTRQRISISGSAYLPNGEIDYYTGQLKPDRIRRHRVQAQRIEHESLSRKEKELTRKQHGKSPFKGSILAVALVMFVSFMFLLVQQSEIAVSQKRINDISKENKAYETTNKDLKAQIAEASDASKICYAAAHDLGMVPAESVEAVLLIAEDPRPRRKSAHTADAGEAPDLIPADAAAQTVQATSVPMTANSGQ